MDESPFQTAMRRAVDVVVAALALVLFLPLAVAVAIGVRCDSQGPVLYRARRVGRGGRLFTLYKFRTMSAGAAFEGPGITRGGDPRVTRMGAWLRATKLDEWPQFFNVLKGEMSLVGPRPEDPFYVQYYTAEQRRVLNSRPGLVSPATLKYRHEEAVLAALVRSGQLVEAAYRERVLPDKLRIDADYLSERTLVSDLRLLGEVALSLLSRRPCGLSQDASAGREPSEEGER